MARLLTGDLIITTLYDAATLTQRYRIDRADPWIEIAGEILPDPTEPVRWCKPDGERWAYYDPDMRTLTVAAENLTVIYRITGYDAQRNVYLAEWPD